MICLLVRKNPTIPMWTFCLVAFPGNESDSFCGACISIPTSKDSLFARPRNGGAGKRLFAIAGDSIPEAKKRIVELLKAKNKLQGGGLDMEPFEVLRDMIRDGSDPRIGGSPQIVKIYRHMNANAYPAWWPDRASGRVTLLGRPLLDYERTQMLVLNPDTVETESTWVYDAAKDRARIVNETGDETQKTVRRARRRPQR